MKLSRPQPSTTPGTPSHRLPSEVFAGSKTLSLEDFAATIAEHVASPGPIRVKKGNLEFEKYFAADGRKAFDWPIHPQGFAPSELLALARLQGWTLKPARLRKQCGFELQCSTAAC